MVIKHKNLEINVNTIDAQIPESLTGYFEWYIPYELLKKTYKELYDSCILTDSLNDELRFEDALHDLELDCITEFVKEYGYDDEDCPISLEEFCDEYMKNKTVTITSGDSCILLLKNIIVNGNFTKTHDLNITGHPFWVLHDLRHIKDCDSFNIYVNEEVERQRLDEAYNDLKALGLKHLMTTEMSGLIKEEFEERFGNPINLKWTVNDPY